MKKLSIIISYYKALANLELILRALEYQSERNFEVIVSEDDSNALTTKYIQEASFRFPIQHLFQKEDKGFRKNMMLNRSIKASISPWLVFIDGDCIPHQHFVRSYSRNLRKGIYLSGRRVMLGPAISSKLIVQKELNQLSLFSILNSDSSKKKEGIYSPVFPLTLSTPRGLVGCNWGIHKEHLIEVNGFDQDYVMAGVGEDVDIEWRLLASGIKIKSIKNKAIVYHLHHEQSYSESNVQKNFELFKEKKKKGKIYCENGLG